MISNVIENVVLVSMIWSDIWFILFINENFRFQQVFLPKTSENDINQNLQIRFNVDYIYVNHCSTRLFLSLSVSHWSDFRLDLHWNCSHRGQSVQRTFVSSRKSHRSISRIGRENVNVLFCFLIILSFVEFDGQCPTYICHCWGHVFKDVERLWETMRHHYRWIGCGKNCQYEKYFVLFDGSTTNRFQRKTKRQTNV